MEKLQRLRVVSFENRRCAEMAELIRKQGGEPVSAPAMREVGREENRAALAFGRSLIAGEVDLAVFFTGVGFRHLLQILDRQFAPEAVRDALRAIPLAARGPKPVAALREEGLSAAVIAPSPNTWRELLAALDEFGNLDGKRVAVLEYGEANEPFLAALRERGARVSPVPVYKWGLPEDLGPLRAAIAAIAAREIDAALFTSSTQAEHLLKVAEGDGLKAPLLEAFHRHVAVFSIGPVCSETLARLGIPVDAEPQSPKMGSLILAASEQARRLAEAKRAGGV